MEEFLLTTFDKHAAEMEAMKAEIEAMKADYEKKLKDKKTDYEKKLKEEKTNCYKKLKAVLEAPNAENVHVDLKEAYKNLEIFLQSEEYLTNSPG